MNKDFEVVTIDDKDYIIIDEITHEDNTFLYLSNTTNEDDTLIRKMEKDMIIPLKDEKEFEIACNLLLKNIAN